jgi:hypothetical protein
VIGFPGDDGGGVAGVEGADAVADADVVGDAVADGPDCVGVGDGDEPVGPVCVGLELGDALSVVHVGVGLADAEALSVAAAAWLGSSGLAPTAASDAFPDGSAVGLSVAVGQAGGVTVPVSGIACAGMESRAPTATVPEATAPSTDITGRRGFFARRTAMCFSSSVAVLLVRAPLGARVPR